MTYYNNIVETANYIKNVIMLVNIQSRKF